MTTAIETQVSVQSLGTSAVPRRPGTWRVGLLGAGYIAEWHAKAIRLLQGVELVAVCDKSEPRAEACAAAFGIPQVYGSLDEMLREVELDAVHILLPPDLHYQAAMQVLDAGVHVFLEKPMCTRAEDCQTLVRHAGQKGLSIGVGHNFLFADPYEQLRTKLRDGVLGRIDHVTITWNKELGQIASGPFDAWMLRRPQNIMLEIGSHSVAQMFDLVGPPDEMRVKATNPVELPSGQVFYRRWQVDAYRGKTAVELRFSFVPGFSEHTVHVRGTLGSAIADLERNTFILRRHAPRDDDFDRLAMLRDESAGLRGQAWRNLRDYVLSKFRLSKRGSAYGWSIAQAMQAFYASIQGEPDGRISALSGASVIATCEEIGRLAGIPEAAIRPSPCTTAVPSPGAARILVLGATGFIGRELVRQLIAKGCAVRVLARNPGKLPPDLQGPLVEVVQGDLANDEDLNRALAGIMYVYHLARAMVKTWDDYQRHDIELTRRLADRCLALGVKRLVYTGTIDSYYAGASAGTITETTPLDPLRHRRNLYARAKAVSEEMLMQMHRDRKLPLVIVRPGIVIGSGGSPFHWGVGMWRHGSVCQIWGEGTNKLPLVLVEDVAKGLIAAMNASGIEGESFNLVGDPCLTAQEYLDELEKHAQIKLQRIPTPICWFYLQDMIKWVAKVLVHHHDRRRPSYHDWESRTQRAHFDCTFTKQRLNWWPVTDRVEFIRLGIHDPVDRMLTT